ncbi:pyruvate kinase family protein [Trichomonas vaginalis G3]|uniref:Pyruvate kinase n=1 Tax=Trichomonas vaginalis (strain ATCC PRA-98 / G3) TaxID=412133 RepID=A2DP65_TRIV3|nr:pyruvate kinase protein [Trichomonas vaginalis G3]EAY17765.1 pyruvate kinase family protein [Trichomonas vaginalis G3]KAI5484415.1 pyruvate kinase protein [Trichomonas vaginalis G3]|eukprot:XP_001329900.1 pyruvate kinase family protein [Trichomonas vaginalis G3]
MTTQLIPKRTKIVATIGPASDSLEVLEQLARAGVNVFRLNFSHSTHEYHKQTLDRIREVEKKVGFKIGVLQDICGPKIRVGKLENPFELHSGDKIIVRRDEIVGKKIEDHVYELSINHPQICDLIKVDEYIYLIDGAIRAKVTSVCKDHIETVIENDGILYSNKGVNFPNTKLNIDVITPKDKLDIEWGAKNDVDFVAISFVQHKQDVLNAKSLIKQYGGHGKVYSKIEKFDAIENIDEIIEASDGIMVARGDLGIEIPFYQVPACQKKIIHKANELCKPVITATQMMLSMVKNDMATRAEISDVANAVLDGTDAVMLSEETAVGDHPAAVVKAMAETIHEIEKIYPYGKYDEFKFADETEMVSSSTARLATRIGVKAIISLTASGQSAVKIARNRPECDILAVTHTDQIARVLTMVWGVTPVLLIKADRLNLMLASTIKGLLQNKSIADNHTYIMTAGYPTGFVGSLNYVRILRKEQIEYYSNVQNKDLK